MHKTARDDNKVEIRFLRWKRTLLFSNSAPMQVRTVCRDAGWRLGCPLISPASEQCGHDYGKQSQATGKIVGPTRFVRLGTCCSGHESQVGEKYIYSFDVIVVWFADINIVTTLFGYSKVPLG